ncbi:hypothetical protein V1294_006211 [Bradyrhizobium sp. AZCC 1678]|uniref:Transposase n=1 Tax=Bradyrhizobium algeriense TaxID=634784 RepID=A0ABU8B5U7_9BRAD
MYYALIARQFKIDSVRPEKYRRKQVRGREPKVERCQTMRPEA